MTLWFVVTMLFGSLWAYVVFGGADFGVGILELFEPKETRTSLRRLGERAIAPVWEANHVWIILALVILFVAFPEVHVTLVTSLHVPLLLMLVGIVLRGTAFTFRYYDVDPDPATTRLWSVLFRSGSILVPFLLGVVAATMGLGTLAPDGGSVFDRTFGPWLNAFPATVGAMVVTLFAWQAAVFLATEVPPDARASAARRARRWSLTLAVMTALVTLVAWTEDVPFLARNAWHPISLGAVLVAIGAWLATLGWLATAHVRRLRAAATLVPGAILAGYWLSAYPLAIALSGGRSLTWPGASAPEATLIALALSLAAALVLVVPGLAVLFGLFKKVPTPLAGQGGQQLASKVPPQGGLSSQEKGINPGQKRPPG